MLLFPKFPQLNCQIFIYISNGNDVILIDAIFPNFQTRLLILKIKIDFVLISCNKAMQA